jgi:hypothetical protein
MWAPTGLERAGMLSFLDPRRAYGRREFLRAGALGLGSLGLEGLAISSRLAAAETQALTTGRSVVLLFLHGGPSQFETFDPKMSAPGGIRSVTGETATSLPGVTFGGSFPRLAKLAHRVAVVRSYVPGDANHDIKPVVHRETQGASLGSIYARTAGTNHPASGMPMNVVLVPRAVDPETQPGEMGFGNFGSAGSLGAAYAGFQPDAAGDFQCVARKSGAVDGGAV